MRDLICEESMRLCVQVYRDRLLALVLTGSLARGEGTFVEDAQGYQVYGDAEFLLVFGPRAALPSDGDLAVIREKLQERIRRRGVRAEITLAAVRPGFLRRLRPSIFAYELRTCGVPIAGDPAVLALIPRFTRADIPLEDAWRMLANRLVEQLESVDELLEGRPTLSPRAHYRTVKLYLDMATSLLVFQRGYAPTYEARARTLGVLAEAPARRVPWPFPRRRFADEVQACTEWKLSATDPILDADRTFWERAIDYARVLWRWELARLVSHEPGGEPADLMALWMSRQPVRERLRGWAHVARRAGWHRSVSRWPEWARRTLEASPRYAVYATATDLLFGLRASRLGVAGGWGGSPGSNGGPHWDELTRRLPVVRQAASVNGGPVWRALAAVVLFNYREFLVNTRA